MRKKGVEHCSFFFFLFFLSLISLINFPLLMTARLCLMTVELREEYIYCIYKKKAINKLLVSNHDFIVGSGNCVDYPLKGLRIQTRKANIGQRSGEKQIIVIARLQIHEVIIPSVINGRECRVQ